MVDKYANIATGEIIQSAANTLTFLEINTGLGIDADRKTAKAMLIDEINYYPDFVTWSYMTTVGDYIDVGLCVSNAVTDLKDVTDRRIMHSANKFRMDYGTAGSAALIETPMKFQFFPPLITAERKIYLGMDSNGLASATTLRVRIYYRVVAITQADFIELAEVFRLVG